MRKIILSLAVSLDGYIEGPNGEYDWCFTDQDYGISDFMKRIDTVFMGRKSYELILKMDDIGIEGFSKLKKYVFSTTLEKGGIGVTIIKNNVRAETERIKNAEGKDIWLFGGAGLTASLLNLGLVDELSTCRSSHSTRTGNSVIPGYTRQDKFKADRYKKLFHGPCFSHLLN